MNPFYLRSFLAITFTLMLSTNPVIAQDAARQAQYDSLFALVKASAYTDKQKALQLIHQVHELSREMADTAKIVTSGRIWGQLLLAMERYKDAFDVLSVILPIAERNSLEGDVNRIVAGMASYYSIAAEYDKAINLHQRVLERSEANGDRLLSSYSVNDIGLIYYRTRHFNEALKYFRKALSIQTDESFCNQIEILYINLGFCYSETGQYDSALHFFNRSLNECTLECDGATKQDALQGMGIVYFAKASAHNDAMLYRLAHRYFSSSYKIAVEEENFRKMADNGVMIGKILLQQQRYDSALIVLHHVVDIASCEQINESLLDAYDQLVTIYNRRGDEKNYMFYLAAHRQLRDQIYNPKMMATLMDVKSKLDQREHQKAWASLTSWSSFKIKQYKKVLVIGSLLLVAAFIIYLHTSIMKKEKLLKSGQVNLYAYNEAVERKKQELTVLIERKITPLNVYANPTNEVNAKQPEVKPNLHANQEDQ